MDPQPDAPKLTTRRRLGRMLVGAAVIVPALAVAAMIAMSHLYLVHYDTRTLVQWIVADAVVLFIGVVLMGEEGM
jgi:hypothetical protein